MLHFVRGTCRLKASVLIQWFQIKLDSYRLHQLTLVLLSTIPLVNQDTLEQGVFYFCVVGMPPDLSWFCLYCEVQPAMDTYSLCAGVSAADGGIGTSGAESSSTAWNNS